MVPAYTPILATILSGIEVVIDDSTAIEVELSRKNDAKLANIVHNYLNSNYQNIIYYTTNMGIANKVYDLAKKSDKFTFRLFKDSNIFAYTDYKPSGISHVNAHRDSKGKFINSVEEELRQLGAFDK